MQKQSVIAEVIKFYILVLRLKISSSTWMVVGAGPKESWGHVCWEGNQSKMHHRKDSQAGMVSQLWK